MADRNGYIGRAPGDSAVTVARQTFSPTGVTTDFTFASGYTVGYLDLFLNGTKLIEGVDYNATDTSTISLVSAAINGDVLEGVAYKAFNLGDGSRIGIQSAGTLVGNVNNLNFVGVGNSISLNGGTIDILIEGGGGAGAAGTWTNYDGNTGVTTTKKVKIQNNLEVTGVTTSTGGFVGALTGNATGLTGTPNITVGSVTGTTGSFSSNVSIGGTLTYEDVTNVDSVGLVTARTGVRVNAGGLIVTAGVSTLAADLSIADKIVHTGDTNTAIRFPAADTFTVETAGSERLRIDSNGRLLAGTNSSRSVGDEVKLQIEGTDQPTSSLSATRNSANAAGPSLNFGKSRGSSVGSNTVVQGDDLLGNLNFFGADGTDTNTKSASIQAFVDGTPGSNDMPGRLVFNTTSDGAASVTERLRIASAGQIGLGGANYGTSGQVILSNGSGSAPTWGNVPAAGLTTEALVSSGIVTTLNLTAAQDHKVTASGITTITVSGGTEADSHTVRIINSGITTVGFSTYFLFPSGSAPSLPTADGAISLISFTVNRVGAGGTQLLAGASLNFS